MNRQEEINEYVNQLENELNAVRGQNQQFQNVQASTMFQSEENDNLVKWQLDINEELERIEHLLRGNIPKRDSNGNEYWEEPKDDRDKLFNEKGVREILKVLKWYLNKNIILSNFDEDDINLRVKQFANVFSDFIFNNYEDFGLDTPEKMKHYPLVIINITNTVEASYFRALHGGERNSLRTARTVTQSEPLGMGFSQGFAGQSQSQKRKFNFFKPSTWR